LVVRATSGEAARGMNLPQLLDNGQLFGFSRQKPMILGVSRQIAVD
jgi:hypothetical protein